MEVTDIVKQVRLCIDEEDFANDYVSQGMDNIIKGKMMDALMWCVMHAEGSMLGGSDETGETQPKSVVTRDYTLKSVSAESPKSLTPVLPDADAETTEKDNTTDGGEQGASSTLPFSNGIITLPSDFLKVVRVKADGWHKAVMNPIEEDSEAYLMVHDDTAKPTKERPQVAIIQTTPQKLELFPTPGAGDTVELTIAVMPSMPNSAGGNFPLPPRVKGGFIYYLAFLVLSAYGDSRAQTMLGIAKMELGIQGT